MTDQSQITVEEGNRLIADFDDLMSPDESDPKKESWVRHPYSWTHLTDLKYHSSFDWIMPVVERIGAMATFHTQSHPDGEVYVSVLIPDIFYQSGKGKAINQYWIATTSFLQWYNSHKSKQ